MTHADDVVGEREMFEALIQGHVDTYRNEIRYVRKDRNGGVNDVDDFGGARSG